MCEKMVINIVKKVGDNDNYLLEANVKDPKELHNLRNDLPFICEKMVINIVKKLVIMRTLC